MIEIYQYEPQDLNMKFNKWAWPLKNKRKLAILRRYLAKNYAYTIFDTKINEPVAVLGFNEQKKGIFYGLIVAAERFDSNPKYAIKMKYLIKCVAVQYAVKVVETVSEDSPDLNKWHEFLGFCKQKDLPKFYRGKDFILWRMEYGRGNSSNGRA